MVAFRPQRGDERETVEGVIADLYPERNAYRKFGLRETAIGKAMLGPLGSGDVGQLTLHRAHYPALGRPPIRESVTAWGTTTRLRKVSRGEVVSAAVRGRKIGTEFVWVLESLAPLNLNE